MTYQQIGVVYFLLFSIIHNVASVCTNSFSSDILSITKGLNPLIYKYESDGSPVLHYISDPKCIFESRAQQQQLLACTGMGNKVQFHIADYVIDKYVYHTKVANEDPSFVRLMQDPDDIGVVIAPELELRYKKNRHNSLVIKCTTQPVATMHLISAARETSSKGYLVGYRLNELDFLKVYEQVYRDKEWIVTRYKIHPTIKYRPQFNTNYEYKEGLFYAEKYVDFDDLYSMPNQISNFRDYFKSSKLTRNYFKDNNLLVIGQLMFEEDTFYESDLISTHFYENTAPIWKSIYDGNWRKIGALIRKIVANSGREVEVHTCAWPSYQSNMTADWSLGTSTEAVIPVPELLVKAAIDVDNPNRSIVFHTFNDPYLVQNVEDKVQDYCEQTTDCQEMHPEFQSFYYGYTFCCKPKHSYIFMKIEDY